MHTWITDANWASRIFCCLCVWVTACGGETSLGVASYTPSTAFTPAGYSHRQIGDNHFEIMASGSSGTPVSRLEKMATVRAAEFGVEQKLGFCKVQGSRVATRCSKAKPGYKSTSDPAFQLTTVTLDVVYAAGKIPPDVSFLASADTFNRLSAELKSDAPSSAETADAARQVKAECGG